MAAAGGLFIACAGAGVLFGLMIAKANNSVMPIDRGVFFLFTAVGLTLLFGFGRRLSGGVRPSRLQYDALVAGILVEVAGLAALPHLHGHGTAIAYWLSVLLIVGLHFLPMALAFGPTSALLGILCASNAAVGLWLPEWSGSALVADGILKLLLGAAMARRALRTSG